MARKKGQLSPQQSEEVKAAVIAALLAGMAVGEAAKRYGIPKQTVSRWRAALGETVLGQVGTQKQTDIAALLLEYLRETIGALTERARLSKDEAWFSKQCAADIADLDGVQFDRAVRVLEAIERSQQRSNAVAAIGEGGA